MEFTLQGLFQMRDPESTGVRCASYAILRICVPYGCPTGVPLRNQVASSLVRLHIGRVLKLS